ncbi:unnamed protein product [Staurois parvus]|uniref:Uncharacterized protein n=1 Tax=Staurois parvus TaxID=386267 RepID=A0ABN9AE68_9NEOB|nr:unnamed protein product [Staurois parvus]
MERGRGDAAIESCSVSDIYIYIYGADQSFFFFLSQKTAPPSQSPLQPVEMS